MYLRKTILIRVCSESLDMDDWEVWSEEEAEVRRKKGQDARGIYPHLSQKIKGKRQKGKYKIPACVHIKQLSQHLGIKLQALFKAQFLFFFFFLFLLPSCMASLAIYTWLGWYKTRYIIDIPPGTCWHVSCYSQTNHRYVSIAPTYFVFLIPFIGSMLAAILTYLLMHTCMHYLCMYVWLHNMFHVSCDMLHVLEFCMNSFNFNHV